MKNIYITHEDSQHDAHARYSYNILIFIYDISFVYVGHFIKQW